MFLQPDGDTCRKPHALKQDKIKGIKQIGRGICEHKHKQNQTN
ncbi:hypothetical protein NC652_034536 [Populus alba x Populus x berolinensis]|nr:hypothetical protein NC652_034536 [Populus alba x Populus x berolinensis]